MYLRVIHFIVSGEAHFTMDITNLVVEGFSQPSVSRKNTEWVSQEILRRFIQLFPEHFASMEPIDATFTEELSMFLYYVVYIIIWYRSFITLFIFLSPIFGGLYKIIKVSSGNRNITSWDWSFGGGAAHCLNLPGRNAFITPLLKIKKFQNFGYRMGGPGKYVSFKHLSLEHLKDLDQEN